MKKKVLTALLIVAVAAPLLYFGGWCTVLFASIVGIGGMIEILKTCRDKKWHPLVKIAIILGSIILLYWSFIMAYIDGDAAWFTIPETYKMRINLVALLVYLIVLLVLECTTEAFKIFDVFYIFSMTVFIIVACQGIIFLRELKIDGSNVGLQVIGFIFLVTCSCDAAAQFFGRRLGKHKMAPITSPNKTWEGAVGGCATATILGFVYTIFLPYLGGGNERFIYGAILSLILSIGAVMGDLIFSSIKRQVHIKDFSDVLPGHGGLLDRFDSLMFNLLIFLCVVGILCAFGVVEEGLFLW